MSAEPTLLASRTTSEGRPPTPDEKIPASSKELSSPEHVSLNMKEKSKGIRAFLPWSNKSSKETESEPENVGAADTLAPASFLSLFRLDHPTFLSERDDSPTYRYSTRFEISLDLLGVIFAAAAGASQVSFRICDLHLLILYPSL